VADSELRPFTGDIRDRAILSAGALRIVFERRGDRIGHRVIVGNIEGGSVLLQSIEGRPQEDWPPSPPFQEGRIELSDGRMVAMLVGMAGKSHWSMSVEADADTGGFTFDVACRMKGTAGTAISTYAVDRSTQPTHGPNAEVQLADSLIVRPVGEASHAILDQQLVLRPNATVSSLPATLRWRYEMRWVGN
jgi:hypothetical protein